MRRLVNRCGVNHAYGNSGSRGSRVLCCREMQVGTCLFSVQRVRPCDTNGTLPADWGEYMIRQRSRRQTGDNGHNQLTRGPTRAGFQSTRLEIRQFPSWQKSPSQPPPAALTVDPLTYFMVSEETSSPSSNCLISGDHVCQTAQPKARNGTFVCLLSPSSKQKNCRQYG